MRWRARQVRVFFSGEDAHVHGHRGLSREILAAALAHGVRSFAQARAPPLLPRGNLTSSVGLTAGGQTHAAARRVLVPGCKGLGSS